MLLPRFPRGMLRQIASSRSGVWLAGCTFAIACFAAVCVAALVAARWEADQRAEAVAANTAAIAAYDIARTFERFDFAMHATIGRLQSPTMTTLDEPVRSLVLFDSASGLPGLGFISVLNENGNVTESPQPSERLSRWDGRDYFTAQRLNPSLGLFISRPFGQDDYASIALSRRVSHEDGTFGGVVVASLRLNYIRDLFDRLAAGSHQSITLLRNDGTVLMRLPFDRNDIGRIISPQPQADHMRRGLASRQIGELPLSVSVSVATEDVAGIWQGWMVALLVAGMLLGSISAALVVVLQREIWRREAAEGDNRHKSDYLAMTSHELRTPLHSILGNADRLRTDAHLEPGNVRRVSAIISSGNHLRGVVDRVLNHLQIESRVPTPRMRRVDLAELLDQCCIIVESEAAAQRLALRYDLKSGAPKQFVTDSDLLRQVLVNLLANSVKFTAKGEVAVEVGGTAEQITIEVKDTGCGVAPAQRHKLFKYGERLGAERTGIQGFGFGLAQSRRLMGCMGGDIGYRENPGGGSIFWIALPAGNLPTEDVPESPATARLSRPLRVLLVDDVAANREIARDVLIERGHAVTEAEGGADAVRLVNDNDFDVVLMDMRMPGVDGLEATRRIRMFGDERGRVPIVAVTANALEQQIIEGRRAGMVEHLTKPFTPDELLSVVERVARRIPTAPSAEPAIFNSDTLAQLAPYMSSGDMERHLLDLARKVENLLGELEAANSAAEPSVMADLSHELAGTAGMFGFAALSVAARRFDAAFVDDPGSATGLVGALAAAARAALAELRELTSAEPVGSA